MPRHTRTHRQRRLAAHAQRERNRDVRRLAVQLHALWRQHLAAERVANGADATGVPGGYGDPQLLVISSAWSHEAA